MVAARAWRWAALGLLLVGPATAVVVDGLRPNPSGHWSGHLASASLSGGVAAVAVGPLRAGYEWGHTVAGWGDVLVIAGAVLFAVSLGATRRVGRVAAWVWGVLALFPPWIYPALGVLVLLATVRAVSVVPHRPGARDATMAG